MQFYSALIHYHLCQQVKLSSLPDQVASIVSDYELTTFPVAVPGSAPETREQWLEWCSFWPVSWRIPELGPGGPKAALLTAQDQVCVCGM